MKKYVYTSVLDTRECAYCDRQCEYDGAAYCKWGKIDIWYCPEHGKFEEVESPMKWRGDQIR